MSDGVSDAQYRRGVSFFDVDDTLISIKSMFRFMRFDILARGRPLSEYDIFMRELNAAKASGATREEASRLYYRQFGGRSVKELAARGQEWYISEFERGGMFNEGVLGALRRHHEAGDAVVLVSGSFSPCLDPVAAYLRADATICSRPEIRDGRYTGYIASPMIGSRKAQAIKAEVAFRAVLLEDCWAYGDHVSDIPMLRSVGHPVAVGGDPVLREYAEQHSWQMLATD